MTLFFIMMERAGLIILLAYAFVHIPMIKETLNSPDRRKNQFILLLLFGVFAIISNFTGVEIQSGLAIVNQSFGQIAQQSSVANTRVLSIGIAGLFGGPLVGISVGLISALVRFWQGGLSPHIYMVSSILIGLCSGISGRYFWKKQGHMAKVHQAMFVGLLMEILQMLCILLLSQDRVQAGKLVAFIALPMISANTLGIGIFTSILSSTRQLEEQARALQTHDVLSLANHTLPYLRQGLTNLSCQSVADIIYKYMKVSAVSLTDRKRILAFVGSGSEHHLPDVPLQTELAKQAIETGEICIAKSRDDIDCHHDDCPLSAAIIIPLKIEGETVGTLKLYFSDSQKMSYVDQQLAQGLGNIFSTQLALGQAEMAARLLQDAEIKSLQAQVNPHFLFNALNTILAMIRVNGEQARQLLLDLSKFLRANLQGARENVIPLSQEIAQVNAYLALEKARFPDKVDFQLEMNEARDGSFPVPPFTLQVLVENAYKHAFKQTKFDNHLKVSIDRNQDSLIISVVDNGQGIPYEKLTSLGKVKQESEEGTGSALENLARRINLLYGHEAIMEFDSSDAGTSVRVILPLSVEKGD
ncbi:sensor histidine kinase [Streptococcus henryi]|uniref:sensor histidine kinase n=1 Tax=Streptococcus henryi TaxID=439219 RepID=UPI00036B9EB8|nr:sensor histidine kinase [Streptococcus henryi]